jgi:putative FmdB family regulatory protein
MGANPSAAIIEEEMPLYEYRCDACSKGFEMLRRMSEADHGVACPACASRKVKRQLSSFAAVGGGGEADAAGCAKPGCGARSGFS